MDGREKKACHGQVCKLLQAELSLEATIVFTRQESVFLQLSRHSINYY